MESLGKSFMLQIVKNLTELFKLMMGRFFPRVRMNFLFKGMTVRLLFLLAFIF
jgi:hypothetical protein